MKKIISVMLSVLMGVIFSAGCSAEQKAEGNKEAVTIILEIGNPIMTADGEKMEIDPGRGTAPVIENGRTMIPVRAAVEAMGGGVTWEEETQTAVLAKGENVILLTIGSRTAFLNEIKHTLDTEPIIMNGRTMLPVRFIAEGFGYSVEWNESEKMIKINKKNNESVNQNGTIAADGKPNEDKASSLVAYFSCTGNTKELALKIAALAGADLYEIVPEDPYTDADISYNDDNSRANKEQNDDSARPAISGEELDLSDYDTIYLGYPIWWGTIPRIINTFMDNYDLSDKKIMPFCTSGGSGISESVSAIREFCPNADVRNGLRGTSRTDEDEINIWISENEAA